MVTLAKFARSVIRQGVGGVPLVTVCAGSLDPPPSTAK